MDDREVMKLALEALENHEGNYKLGDAGCYRHEKAITALREALAEPTTMDYALGYAEGFNDACKPKKEALAQEQELVAWLQEQKILDDANKAK